MNFCYLRALTLTDPYSQGGRRSGNQMLESSETKTLMSTIVAKSPFGGNEQPGPKGLRANDFKNSAAMRMNPVLSKTSQRIVQMRARRGVSRINSKSTSSSSSALPALLGAGASQTAPIALRRKT